MDRLWIAAATAALTIGCTSDNGSPAGAAHAAGESGGAQASTPAKPAAPAPAPAPVATPSNITGEIAETMDSGGYTYVRIDRGDDDEVWAAAPRSQVTVGDVVILENPMPMNDFASPSLGRSFDVIYFASSIQSATGESRVAPKEAASADVGEPVPKAEGGQTIAEVYEGKAELAGKEVAIRGKVVKYNAGIMGKNWIHLQDGTGAAGTNDLTITTDATAAVGDTVIVRGTLVADKDFGFGYAYDLIVEDAEVTVE